MTVRLPLLDAPLLDVPAELRDPREASPVPCVAVVPARDARVAMAFAAHLVRAARVAGARPTVVVTERAERGSEVVLAPETLRAHFVEAGATQVLLAKADAEHATETARELVFGASGLVVAIGCDVPLAMIPTFTIAITEGRPLTAWSAMARAARRTLDAELSEPRSDLARGLVSALDRHGALGPKAE